MRNNQLIAPLNHLIHEEIESMWQHLVGYWIKSTNPDIALLHSRGIEPPASIFLCQLWPEFWIAMILAELIGCAVFSLKMEDINRKTTTIEIGISLCIQVTFEAAIVVIPDNLWKCLWCWEDSLQECLAMQGSKM